MYISTLFLCCRCFMIVWYVCVTNVYLSLMYILKTQHVPLPLSLQNPDHHGAAVCDAINNM